LEYLSISRATRIHDPGQGDKLMQEGHRHHR
jgi:hypothetical protein